MSRRPGSYAARFVVWALALMAAPGPSFGAGLDQPPRCFVLGDSLAQGVSAYAPECEAHTRVGISSRTFARLYQEPTTASSVLISLGANDPPGSAILQILAAVRLSVHAKHVVWIMPAKPQSARAAITAVAGAFGDRRIDTRAVVGGDGLHLGADGYKAVAVLAGLSPFYR